MFRAEREIDRLYKASQKVYIGSRSFISTHASINDHVRVRQKDHNTVNTNYLSKVGYWKRLISPEDYTTEKKTDL